MPSRVIRGEINRSDSLSRVSIEAELTFRALLLAVDDYGRFDGRLPVLLAELFPLRRDVGEAALARWLEELVTEGCVAVYRVEDRPYLHLPKWEKHRGKGRRAAESKYPNPPAEKPPEGFRGDPGKSADCVGNPPVGRGTRDEGRGTQVSAKDADLAAGADASGEGERPQVQALMRLLHDLLTQSGVEPSRTAKDRDQMRLLLERDGRSAREIADTIAWLFGPNTQREAAFVCHSARSIREKWDRIQVQRNRKAERPPRSTTVGHFNPNHSPRAPDDPDTVAAGSPEALAILSEAREKGPRRVARAVRREGGA